MSKFQFLFRFSFLDHYNSSSSSLKTATDNSSSRFSFRNENYTVQQCKERKAKERCIFIISLTAAAAVDVDEC